MKISIPLPPTDDEFNALVLALNQYNESQAGPLTKEKVSCFIKDDLGQIKGGIIGDIAWGWLYIEGLWVEPTLRKSGWGSALVTAIEDYAQLLGVTNFRLETTSFQALAFYQKLGYSIFGELEDMPPGHTCYFLKKQVCPPL
jgi:ribosomal protein S18 acetylase RimI-like enzyme